MTRSNRWRALSGAITFEQLNVFQMAAKIGSFTETAERLYLTRSAVSQRIKRLESAAATPLFSRRARGLQLTPAGVRFLEFSSATLEQFSQVWADIDELTSKSGMERLSIASGTAIMHYIMPRLLTPFHHDYPGISVTLTMAVVSTIEQLVSLGKVDLGIRQEPVSSPDLEKVLLMKGEMVLIAPKSLQDTIDALFVKTHSRVKSLPMILSSRSTSLWWWQLLEQWAGQRGITLKVVMEIDDLETIKQSVLYGLGCAVIPLFGLHGGDIGTELIVVHDIGLPIARFYIVYKRDQQLSFAAKSFITFAQQRYEDLSTDHYERSREQGREPHLSGGKETKYDGDADFAEADKPG
jgi:DNA-binding transcriptional LysR family regulator